MRGRPTIGVTTQTLDASSDLPRCWVMSQRYVQVLVSAGAVPWLVPLFEGDEVLLRAIYDRLDGIFLPGGIDMDPATYGEAKDEKCGRTDSARDWAELTLTRWAIAEGKPLLAVCRGLQVINVAAGGTLYQDLTAYRPGSEKHDYFPKPGVYGRDRISHAVRVAEGTRLASLLEEEWVPVNSMHHQGIKTLGENLVPSAFSQDGLIEAVESPDDSFMIGVQWHPEDLADKDAEMRSLFDAFIDASIRYRTEQEEQAERHHAVAAHSHVAGLRRV
jgi:putative glutamine amidotransferase